MLCAALAPAQSVLIRNGRVIDGSGAPARAADVLVIDGRIREIAPSLAAPAGVPVFDATGKSVLPGLFDLHTHVPYATVGGSGQDWGKNLKAYLRAGITSLADFGTYPETFAPMRRLIESGVLEAPRVHFAARFTTPGGHGAEGGRGEFFTQEVLTPRQARAAIARVLPYKPDVVKVFTDGWRYGTAPEMSSMEEPTLRVIVEEAHKAGIPVLTHTVTLSKAKIAARAGVDAIMHGIQDVPVDEELAGFMAANRVAYGPTQAVYEPRAGYINEPLLSRLLEPAAVQALANRRMLAEPSEARIRKYEILKKNVAALHKAGVRIVTGTDAGITGTHHGWASLRELKLLVSSGLKPLDAIQAATANAAKVLRVDKQRGTLSPGLEADILIVDGNPDQDIAAMDRIAALFTRGRRADLDALTQKIHNPGPTPIPAKSAVELLEDFESPNGRSRLDTFWVNQTDSGHDHTEMLFQRTLRNAGNRALSIQAHLSETERPFGRMNLPLTPGAIEPMDVRKFRGVEFEARGDGPYTLRFFVRRAAVQISYAFEANSEWKRIRVPFASLGAEWRGDDVTMLQFEIAGPAGARRWLELDTIRLYAE
jgi:imidazolonepropionase-like amidohydrolase